MATISGVCAPGQAGRCSEAVKLQSAAPGRLMPDAVGRGPWAVGQLTIRRPSGATWLTSCRASRMTRPRSCRAGSLAAGRTRPPVLVTRRLPQQALDRIVARCDMTLYDGQGPGHAADGGGREGA